MTQQRRVHPMFFFFPVALVAIALTVYFGLRGKPDPGAAQAHADFDRILSALDAYRAAQGSLPEEGDLAFLVPEYLPELPRDPWGRPYLYASDGQKPFLQCYGEDGVRGGNGSNQDHTHWDGHAALGR